jgi:putative oxidoreductase
MQHNIEHHEALAILLVRVFLGVIIFFQGYDALFRVKIVNVARSLEPALANMALPKGLAKAGAWTTSLVELTCGILLIVGYCQHYTLLAVSLNLIVVSILFSMLSGIWDMKHVFPRMLLAALLLYLPAEMDIYSLNNLLNH